MEQAEQQIKGVKLDIKQERAHLQQLAGEHDAAEDKLREAENQQAEAARALYEARFALSSKEASLADLRARHARLNDEIANGLLSLEDNLRALYLLGAGNGLEGVLSPGGRADKMRVEGYLQQLRAERVAALHALRRAREENAQVQREIEFTVEALTQTQLVAENEQTRLDALRGQHAQVVDTLEAQQREGDARIKRMQRDQQALEQTLQKLEEKAEQAEAARKQDEQAAREKEAERQASSEQARKAQELKEEAVKEAAKETGHARKAEQVEEKAERAAQKDEPPAEAAPKSQQTVADNGEIPVRGRKVRGFGEPTGVGELRSRGVFFAAPEGARVRAVADGKVVFADWVRGYGQLLIVQHKGGYLSLYAQNEALLKRQGAAVQRGEVLATAGRSGGERQTGVYVEVRRGGQPINPTRWSAWPKK